MVEMGYLAACQVYYRKLVANVSIYNQRHIEANDHLEMEHFIGTFVLLAIGLLCSTIAFGFELIAIRFDKNWKILRDVSNDDRKPSNLSTRITGYVWENSIR